MPQLHLTATLLVCAGALAGCQSATAETQFGKAATAACHIVSETAASGTEIRGFLKSDEPIDGTFDLTVIATGAGGSIANIRQGGAFVAAPGVAERLGHVRLGPGQVDAASLVVTLGRGQVLSCPVQSGSE